MTQRIHILPENLANKIAAGEVVERPASVVKELIENALDAQAKRIVVALRGGGKQSIRVSDDGMGMESDDALLAIERHATSKITRDEDLLAISTFGFRGEALPSIAAVSRFQLLTATKAGEPGTEITIEGGVLRQVRPVGCPVGTVVEVRQLFFNTPARLKFLKSNATELGHITHVVTYQALSHPHVSFTLTHHQKTLLDLPAHTSYFHRIAALWGKELVHQLIPREISDAHIRLTAFIAPPTYTRTSREHQFIFVNGRYVRDRLINHATQEAYRHTLPLHRHPVFFLFLFLDPQDLDVNVHPCKIEVRFRRQDVIHNMVVETFRQALAPTATVPLRTLSPKRRTLFSPPPEPTDQDQETELQPIVPAKEIVEPSPPPEIHRELVAPASLPTPAFPRLHEQQGREDLIPLTLSPGDDVRVIGQLHRSFILLESGKGLLVLDQHAAQERILYEKLKQGLQHQSIPQQELLFPLIVELSLAECFLFQQFVAEIAQIGFQVELFGEKTLIIRGVPALLGETDYRRIFLDLLDQLRRFEQVPTREEIMESILTTMACHDAIKAYQPLQQSQMEDLVKDLLQTKAPQTCPHGRPLFLALPITRIRTRFLR
jgi:DNA mismatch repair protein MutL